MAKKLKNTTILGAELKGNSLPTSLEVIQCVLFEKSQSAKCSWSLAINSAASKIEAIWQQTSIPIIRLRSIALKIESLITIYKHFRKSSQRPSFEEKILDFKKENSLKLFVLSLCQCPDLNSSKCPRKNKVPGNFKEFLMDQRNRRKMFLTLSMKRNEKKKNEKKKTPQNKTESNQNNAQTDQKINSERLNFLSQLQRKGYKMTNVGGVLNATGISYREGAAICNAFLKDMGLLTKENIIGPHKILHAKRDVRSSALEKHSTEIKAYTKNLRLFAVFFDGKKDRTFQVVRNCETGRRHPSNETENHYVVLFEPESKFFTHVTPNGANANDTASCLYDKLHSSDIQKLACVGCDGTNFNTGKDNGIF